MRNQEKFTFLRAVEVATFVVVSLALLFASPLSFVSADPLEVNSVETDETLGQTFVQIDKKKKADTKKTASGLLPGQEFAEPRMVRRSFVRIKCAPRPTAIHSSQYLTELRTVVFLT